MSGKKSAKVRHASLEMPDADVVVKKKAEVLKGKSRFLNLSDVLKHNSNQSENQRKSMTQVTLDYFFKHCPTNKEKNHIFTNNRANVKRNALQKQNSVGAYPIKIEISSESDLELNKISRSRPATVCVDNLSDARQTDALALERPRKKLSFREPEIEHKKKQIVAKKASSPEELKRHSFVTAGILHRTPSVDNFDLESQAMRVVRTVGQAFEVCHKLSIVAPENENFDQDEQDTLTQDLLSDNFSDFTSEKPKKDLISSEGASDKISLPPDDTLYIPENNNKNAPRLDILAPPPTTNSNRKSPLISAETYASPHSDGLTSVSGGSGSGSLPPAGSALSAHHELQLMREQLEQQSQQTQAAMAQLQLAREQLAAEQSARLEAQARTHQLLVHNRELLDHIAALVAHLQGGEKSGQQQTPPHMTMPQPVDSYLSDLSDPSVDNSPVLQALGLNSQGLIENRAVTSCLPPSPLRTTFNPGGTVFNFGYPGNPPMDNSSFEAQLLQRLQALSGYTPPTSYPYNYPPNLPPYLYNQPMMNNNYTLQPPPQKKMPPSPLAVRHSYAASTADRISPGRTSDPIFNQQQYQSQQNLAQYPYQQNHLQVQNAARQSQEGQFIKPLAQMGTLTTTDAEGRVRVIVPVPSNSNEETRSLLANLRVADDLRPLNGPAITRSTSEKVPNRSELMSQVQRTAWARHTTK